MQSCLIPEARLFLNIPPATSWTTLGKGASWSKSKIWQRGNTSCARQEGLWKAGKGHSLKRYCNPTPLFVTWFATCGNQAMVHVVIAAIYWKSAAYSLPVLEALHTVNSVVCKAFSQPLFYLAETKTQIHFSKFIYLLWEREREK